jgi:hypothetical protein
MGGRDKDNPSWHPQWIHALFARTKLRQINVRAYEKQFKREQDRIAHEKVHGGLAHFGQSGFADRINVSLNSVIEQSLDTPNTGILELRTLSEQALNTVLPEEFAQTLLKSAGKWTDTGRASLNTYDPFVSLSEAHAQGSKAQPDPILKNSHTMICNQIINILSSLTPQTHLGIDEGNYFREEKYIWCAAHFALGCFLHGSDSLRSALCTRLVDGCRATK